MIGRKCMFAILFAAGLLSACRSATPQVPTVAPDLLFTQAAQTVIAGLTQAAPAATATPVVPLVTDTLGPTSTPLPTATPQPSVTPAPTDTQAPGTQLPAGTPAPDYTLLFEDDFSNQTLWAIQTDDSFGFEYADDAYRIYANILNAAIWSIRDQEFGDVSLEVDASQTAGPQDGYYGLVCRHQDEDNYYSLAISSNGTFGIAKMENGEFEFLQEGTAQAGMINTGRETNRVRADCIGDSLSLYANGNKLLEVQDDDFNSGAIGLVAGTRLTPGVDVRYDNFAVSRP